MQFDQLKRREFITPLCCCAAVTGPLSARAQTADGDAGDRLSWREQRLGNTPVAFLTQINILPRYSS
jgi:hypothetical protein